MKIAYGFVLFFVFGLTSLVWGCSCNSTEWEEQFSRAEGVFYGQLLDGPVVLNYEDKYVSTHQYTFQVFEAWKGVQFSPITIATSSSSSLCGTTFRKGTPYVILVNESNGNWSTGSCAGNVLGDQAVDLRKKNQIRLSNYFQRNGRNAFPHWISGSDWKY